MGLFKCGHPKDPSLFADIPTIIRLVLLADHVGLGPSSVGPFRSPGARRSAARAERKEITPRLRGADANHPTSKFGNGFELIFCRDVCLNYELVLPTMNYRWGNLAPWKEIDPSQGADLILKVTKIKLVQTRKLR